ncbi:hypothetical protein ROV95_17620 [Stenotrophomonas maltophilia group sp. msm1]|uniref:hypothetical protein n=1 Tax=Stenotrophomonas maltophilia group sp. msm1 TaxID=3061099 RepID=UPI002893F629|nr:hypothetical protein [Stenotrophomonas maltophilia group sp. msm1]MDT3557917.1 hypothetical protein [Stenotrophomonas maltophilia group sp. msm1]
MTTDKKTLADVQPGGRVRLGDALPPLPCTGYSAYSDGTEPLYTAEQMRDYARAALSAQPSPGGQGDALDLDRVLSLADLHAEESREDGVRLLDRGGLLAFAQDVAAAFAARQPVGTDDATDRALGETIDQRDRCEEVADELAARIASITGVDIGEHSSANCPWQNAIEAAEEYKPAQAVDLGQFRDAITREYANSRALCDMPRILECERLLALIDSMAVGNG